MEPIKDIVHDVIQKLSQKEPTTQIKIQNYWEKIAGKEGLKHTRIDRFYEGQLTIVVDSPAWLYQLNTKKTKFLKDFKLTIPEVKNLVFIVGKT
ncbi:MAG: hypothetical protein A2Z88_11135 [Omnitrophica WOR_2 bacterium GWA2_47_8]|nr:MAG: hypothetical protein A2Z88_11135 [Omnitrophica WOR_2 bacterium GWA2_47_8]